MRLFFEYIKLGFKSNTVYKINYIMGLIGAFIQLFITVAIWKALYAGAYEISGISFGMLTTNFIISIGLQNAFSFDDFAVQSKVNDGTIVNEFIKPVDYRVSLLAQDIGNIMFKLITNFMPIVLIAVLFIGIEKPHSIVMLVMFLVSICLGFIILWGLSMIVKMSTFWILNVWSVSVLKGVLVSVFSGITLPIWFLPQSVISILKYTPFESIYFSPIQIYLGNVSNDELLIIFLKQLIWALVLFGIGNCMWNLGRKRLIVQGG